MGPDRANRHDGVVTPYEGRPATGWDPAGAIPSPLQLHRTTVPAGWVDYNGHMSESCFLLAFGDSADAFFRYVGIDEAYRAAGHSLFTAETHLHHRGEASQGDPLRLELRVLDLDSKRVHLFHELYHEGTGALLATAEQLLLHVDTVAGRVVPTPAELAGRLRAVRAAHAALPRPAAVGHVMGIPHPTGPDHGAGS
jgi:acyl-CoA thioester hydrolase